MPLAVTIAGKQSPVLSGIGAVIPVAFTGNDLVDPRSVVFKSILFSQTLSSESDYSDLVELLRTNQDAIMATIGWGGTFAWDFDTDPVLDIPAGSNTGFYGSADYSAYERISNWPTATAAACYGDVAFHIAGSGFVDTSPAGQTFLAIARCSWALFQGDGSVANSGKYINDASILTPNAATPWPPLPFTNVGPTVYDTPSSPGSTTQYKILIPTKQSLYLTEANTFTLL